MNKNSMLVLGGIVVLLVAGGLIFYAGQQDSTSPSPQPQPGSPAPAPQPQAAKPGAPIVVTKSNVAPSDTTAVVTGIVNPNGAFTNYWYEYGTTQNLGSKTANQAIGSGYSDIPSPGYITGLTKDTTYFFRLVAENSKGKSMGTQQSFRTTQGNPPPVGSAPSSVTLAASGMSRTTANLNGRVNPNKASTQYWFEYGKSADLGNTTSLVSAGDGSANVSASVSISGLDPDTRYYFRMNAQNQFGTVNGAILNFKTLGPPAPMSPSVETKSAINVASSTVTMRGTVNPGGAETTYWFEYSSDSLLGAILLRTTTKKSAGAGTSDVSVSADVATLSDGTKYYFRVVGQNSQGIDRGAIMTFTTN